MCDDVGFVGWFPVCTGFMACPPAEQELFARSHWIEVVPEEMTGERIALSPTELRTLSERHEIIAHTASNLRVAEVTSDEDLQRELVEPKQYLERVTGREIPVFAWMMGTPYGGHPRHDAALRNAGYRYVLSNTMIQRIR